jgi:hypothetical protein
MTIDLLIQAIVRQTTILIAQLATARGVRAPLAQVANQVFLELVAELERQRVSRKVSADMFGLGLRTYRRKIQRLSEGSTERGRSLWEAVLECVRTQEKVTRFELLNRFACDDEMQVKAVLRDLCESRLVIALGSGPQTVYRMATDDELAASVQGREADDGLGELLIAIIYREGPLSLDDIADRVKFGKEKLEALLGTLVDEGRIERIMQDGVANFRATRLVIPLGATAGWEAAMFDHFKAMVTTIICRLRGQPAQSKLSDDIGGSTYTFELWSGHPLTEEVYGTLGRFRAELSELRERAAKISQEHGVPDAHTRAVIYVGQYLVNEGSDDNDEQAEREE